MRCTSALATLGAQGKAERTPSMTTPRLTRRGFALAATATAATLAVPGLMAQNRIEKLGYFKAEGLDLEISDFAGGAKALQALVGGSADVVSGAYEHTINMQSKNQYIQSIVLMGRAPQIAIGVSNKTMPGYKGLKDLKGKKIGVSAPGSSTNMIANLVLSRGGLQPSDVSFVGVGTSSGALAALRSGQIDAMSNTDPIMTMLAQKGDVTIIRAT